MNKFLILVLLGIIAVDSNSQCLNAINGLWPSSTFTPACSGSSQNITACGYASEYSNVYVTSGQTYTFSSSIATDIITLGDAAGSISYATGTGSIIWTATFTGVIRFYTHTAGCGSQSSCRTRMVACPTVVSSGCLTASNGLYPSSTFTPPCNGNYQSITTCGFASEYSNVYVTSGQTYTFSSSITTDIITISDAAGTVVYATGTGTVVWTASFTGVIRFYTHTSGCGASTSCRTRRVKCGTVTPTSQNCSNAVQVCDDNSFSGNSSGYGIQELTNSNSGCLGVENQSSWYFFQASTSGAIGMTITTTVDYDFAIWGPNPDCAALGSPVRCSFSASSGNTGLGNGANDLSEGTGGNRWVALLNVTAGETYVLLIDNYTANSTPFTLNWAFLNGASLNCTPLPIDLLSFTGKHVPETNANLLEWRAAKEFNNDHYLLERSEDAVNWTPIAKIKGKNNSGPVNDYSFNDYGFSVKSTNYYRLSQTDLDGTKKVFNQLVIDNTSFDDDLSIYPNPTENFFIIESKEKIPLIELFDMFGNLLFKQEHMSKVEFTPEKKGLYLVTITTQSGEKIHRKLIKK